MVQPVLYILCIMVCMITIIKCIEKSLKIDLPSTNASCKYAKKVN